MNLQLPYTFDTEILPRDLCRVIESYARYFFSYDKDASLALLLDINDTNEYCPKNGFLTSSGKSFNLYLLQHPNSFQSNDFPLYIHNQYDRCTVYKSKSIRINISTGVLINGECAIYRQPILTYSSYDLNIGIYRPYETAVNLQVAGTNTIDFSSNSGAFTTTTSTITRSNAITRSYTTTSPTLNLSNAGSLTIPTNTTTSGTLNLSNASALTIPTNTTTSPTLNISNAGSLTILTNTTTSPTLNISNAGSLTILTNTTTYGTLNLSNASALTIPTNTTTSPTLNLSNIGSYRPYDTAVNLEVAGTRTISNNWISNNWISYNDMGVRLKYHEKYKCWYCLDTSSLFNNCVLIIQPSDDDYIEKQHLIK